jgi:uncharacterized protein YwqG
MGFLPRRRTFGVDAARAAVKRRKQMQFWPAIEALIKPAVQLEPTWSDTPVEPAIGSTFFGGIPDLPASTRWPTRDKIPMEHIAQINCAEISALVKGLPATGTLNVFFNSQFGDDERWSRCARVLYSDESRPLRRCTVPKTPFNDDCHNTGFAPWTYEPSASIKLTAFASLPMSGTEEVEWTDEVTAAWNAVGADIAKQLVPSEVRNEPYDDHRVLGYIQQADWCGVIERGDTLLLTVDSDGPFQWGDCDPLHFVIKETDLAARDFSKVRVYSNLG